ncbi:MAG: exodeoxyribonuclease VII small subunit [Planctomycetota bacterium]|nr:exodeoxyribonuclease VII small subunit [Planctomycetota bacterium]
MTPATKTNPENPSFEEAVIALESIVHDLEEGQIGLAEALKQYEQGVALLGKCYQMLESAERKIELLSGFDAAGNPVVVPFDDESSLNRDEKGGAKTRRRTAPKPSARPATETEVNVDEGPTLF